MTIFEREEEEEGGRESEIVRMLGQLSLSSFFRPFLFLPLAKDSARIGSEGEENGARIGSSDRLFLLLLLFSFPGSTHHII